MSELSNVLDAVSTVLGAIGTITLLASNNRARAVLLYIMANAFMIVRTYVEIHEGSPSLLNVSCLCITLIVGLHGLPELIIELLPTIKTIAKAIALIVGFAAAMYLAMMHDNYVHNRTHQSTEVEDVVRNYTVMDN